MTDSAQSRILAAPRSGGRQEGIIESASSEERAKATGRQLKIRFVPNSDAFGL